MTLESAPQPGTVPLSTSIDAQPAPEVSGGGRSDPGDKGNSVENVLSTELARLKAEDKPAGDKGAKADEAPKDDKKADGAKTEDKKADADADKAEKAKPDDKAARARTEQGKFAKADENAAPEGDGDKAVPEKAQDGQAAQEKGRQSEGRQFAEPPARFLPKAREVWANVPNAVKADFHRISQEHETEIQQYKASHERYSQFKEFDDLAKGNGRDLRESLTKLNEVENMLARDPIAGLDAVLREIGPRMANGQPMSLYDVANYVVQNGPEAYQQRSQQAQQASQQSYAEAQIQSLRDQINNMQMEQTAASIIEPFKAQPEHSRYAELEEDIAFFLSSGKIPASLSPYDRLAAAYDMAERINPRSSVDDDSDRDTAPATQTDRREDPAGQKSIRGAPSGGFDPSTQDAETDLETILRREMRKMARA